MKTGFIICASNSEAIWRASIIGSFTVNERDKVS